MPAARRCTGEPVEAGSIHHAISNLVEALKLLDEEHAPPEIGARLQGIIDDLEGYGR